MNPIPGISFTIVTRNIATPSIINIVLLLFLFCLEPLGLAKTELQKQPKFKARASAEDDLHEPFVIQEKHLRKLNEAIKKRMSEVAKNAWIIYIVSFSDSSYYTTDDIDKILQEENPKTNKIVAIDIYAVDTSKAGPNFGLFIEPGRRPLPMADTPIIFLAK